MTPAADPSSNGPRTLIVGASGQLGATMVQRLADRWAITAYGRAELDLLDSAAVRAVVAAARPDVVVNCAAYTNVEGAEGEAERAFAVNGVAVGVLARAAREAGATFVHYSTDFVFSGREDKPHAEHDAPEPESIYAQSKLVGEWLAADAPSHYVLRVESLFGGPLAKSSIDRIVSAILEGRESRVFHDRTVSPSFVDDVVDATAFLVEQRAPSGVYHCVNTGTATWDGVAAFIAEKLGRPTAPIVGVSVRDVQLKARRPQYAALANDKLVAAGFAMPTWRDAIERHLARVAA